VIPLSLLGGGRGGGRIEGGGGTWWNWREGGGEGEGVVRGDDGWLIIYIYINIILTHPKSIEPLILIIVKYNYSPFIICYIDDIYE